MLNVLFTSLFMVSYVGSNETMFPNVSSRIAVVAGKSAQLFCGSGDGSEVRSWDHYSPTSSNGSQSWINTRIYNGVDIREEFKPNINWTRNEEGKWLLHITFVIASNWGYYRCVRSEHATNNTISISAGIIYELIVFGSDPQCKISQDVYKLDEYIVLRCNLKYFGSMAPVMKWTKNGIELDAANRIIYNVTQSEVTSIVRVMANSSLHNSVYSCKCYFDQSCNQAGSWECKVPDYQYTWTSPILLVEYHPRYINIVPEKKVFHPGETINCSADGYPTPEYKWRNLEDGLSKMSSGPVLTITIEMIRNAEYIFECNATNVKDDIGIRRNITFAVKATFSIVTSVTISMGILSVFLLFAILFIRLEYVKDWITKITARFRKQANVQHEAVAGEGEAGVVVPEEVEEDPYGGYVGIRRVAEYLEMIPDTEPDHNEDNLAIGGIAEIAEAAIVYRQSRSNGLHAREVYSSYVGADGTEYMEMNGFRPPPTTNPPTLPRSTEPVLYARIDHTLQLPSPVFK